jgi:carboxylesterase
VIGAVLSVFAALALGARAAYPRYFERRAVRRRPLGPDGIVVGASPLILRREGAPGVLLLHGAGDTPQVLAELATHLYERGYSVRVPLLAGHGRQLAELTTADARKWHNDASNALAEMRASHDWVGLIGLSLGGALAIQLAAEKRDIPALVLLAPYVAMPPLARRAAVTSRGWGWLLPYFSSFGSRSVRDAAAAARGLGHGVLTPAALRAIYHVVGDATRALPHVTAPTLVIQSREDNRISAASATEAFARLGASEKQFVWVEGAAHVITVDYGREHVFALATEWLDSQLKISRPTPT